MPATAKIKPVLKLDFTDFGCINKNENHFTQLLQRDFTIEINDRPDLLIFREGSHLHRLYNCKKLFWTDESVSPDWAHADYGLTCHYIDSPRHLRLPHYPLWGTGARAENLLRDTNEDLDALVARKTQFCSAVISNANTRRTPERIKFFQKLNARKPLASGGRFMNTIGGPLPMGTGPKHAFNHPFKFHLCYENKELPGYTTEKLADAMWARCVPIYWGNPRVGEEFNTNSMLCRYDYPDDETFIEKILEVDRDEAQYRALLAQPYFHGNTPNRYYSEDRVLEFFHRIADDRTPPLSARRRFWHFGRWRLVKKAKG
jgi:hypothetical protein